MPHYHTAEKKHNIKTANRPFEDVAKFKCLGTSADQNCVHEEIKSRLNVRGGGCFLPFGSEYFVSPLLFRNMQIKIYKTLILPFGLTHHGKRID
jgi:hypothetical protein